MFYYLYNMDLKVLSKTLDIRFPKYKGKAIRLSLQTPYSVDEVVIGNKKTQKRVMTITTFKDSNGKIIERAIDKQKEPLINRLYTHFDNVIGENEYVESTEINTYKLYREILKDYLSFLDSRYISRTVLWDKISQIITHASTDINTNEKVISQIKITPTAKAHKLKHTFIEYPHIINGKVQQSEQRNLSFIVDYLKRKVMRKTITAKGTQIPEEDSFLAYRALPINDLKIPITEKFILEHGLQNKNITIEPNYNPLNEDSGFIAIFNSEDGHINFNSDYKFKSKSKVVSTSRHEVEHGWQYYLDARLGTTDTDWKANIYDTEGRLSSLNLIKEAESYHESIKNYIPYYKNPTEYLKQLIERLANEKGSEAQIKYDKEGETIRKSFPHIPKEYL